MLLEKLIGLAEFWWCPVFAQERSFRRAIAVLVFLLAAHGRRTVSGALAAEGRTQCDWRPDYAVFSRGRWDVRQLSTGVIATAMTYIPDTGFIAVFVDDTVVKKSSRVIETARWQFDPLGPPFHTNLKYGLRYLHVALGLPLHQVGHSSRAISVDFELAPPAKRPGKRASEEERAEYRRLKKEWCLGARAVAAVRRVRAELDTLGYAHRQLLTVVDGGYTNSTVLANLPERVDIIGRARKDMALCRPTEPGERRVYGERLPTPEEMRKDQGIPYQKAECHYGGQWRTVRFKEVSNVLWRNGAKRRLLRLVIVAPTPYASPGPGCRMYYRHPAYLITTDLTSSPQALIQAYVDRWQIEVLHRDLKTGLGLGQAQVWSPSSVGRVHSAVVAAYAMLTLSALSAFGPERTAAFPPIPAWRRRCPPRRASQNDLITMLRNDLASHGPLRPNPKAKLEETQATGDWALPAGETYALA